MAKKEKVNLEFLLVKAEVKGLPEKGALEEPEHRTGGLDLAAHRRCVSWRGQTL